MICVTATESGTDEDCEAAGRIARSLIDHYIRRPSLEDRALEMLAKESNKSLFVPGEAKAFCCCDLAAVMMHEGRVRWLTGGTSQAGWFLNGRLEKISAAEPGPVLGERLAYDPRLEPEFELKEGENAFLLATRKLWDTVSAAEMEQALSASADASEWMDRLIALAGAETQFCATTVFVQPMRKGLLGMLHRAGLPRQEP